MEFNLDFYQSTTMIKLVLIAGKSATFRAVVTGEPKPTITWARNKGDITDPEKYNTRYDVKAGEYILQVK